MTPWGVKRLFRHTSRTRDDVRREVSEEIAFHLEMRVEELMRGGLPAADAHAPPDANSARSTPAPVR